MPRKPGQEQKKQTLPKKILVANRGEIAVRIFHTLQQMGIHTVAIYSEPDAHSLHVRTADRALPLTGDTLKDTYLNSQQILTLAQAHGVDAIHPGYGFLSENAAFAQACANANITFIGPAPKVIEQMGDKIVAKALMEEAGVPTLPGWTGSLDDGLSPLKKAARSIGYPVLIKAAAGGGGKGMRIVHHEEDLEAAVNSAASEARNAFGDERVFLEKYLARPRHIEFQIFGDTHGHVVHLFERDCSIQRRHQKIIEEAPGSHLSDTVREKMAQAAIQAGKAVNYTNAGTVEFLLDDQTGEFYFLEMNTRLQVEHPVTELITGRDLVREQIQVASGAPLSFIQEDLQPNGHAIECRIYAEDPYHQFMPATGKLLEYHLPPSPFVRLDTGISIGDSITIHFDPMLAKLMVWGENRTIALDRMAWALQHFVVLGVTHNLNFLQQVIHHPTFQSGAIHTHFLEEYPLQDDPPVIPEAAWLIAALEATQTQHPLAPMGSTSGSESHVSPTSPFTPWQTLGGWRNTP